MRQEPQELGIATSRASRSKRHDALARARKLISDSHAGHATRTGGVAAIDEAFAAYYVAKAPEATPAADPAPEGFSEAFLDRLAAQVRQIDEQRGQLAALLDGAVQGPRS